MDALLVETTAVVEPKPQSNLPELIVELNGQINCLLSISSGLESALDWICGEDGIPAALIDAAEDVKSLTLNGLEDIEIELSQFRLACEEAAAASPPA
jgi:hypothetical protein